MTAKTKLEYMLANDHASITLSSLVYDPSENNLLVAAFTVATSVELLAAIKTQLEKHGKNSLRTIDLAGSETVPLRGAGFGYVTVKCSLRSVNARGMATVFSRPDWIDLRHFTSIILTQRGLECEQLSNV